ncbi:MAG: DUF342 domain-containing protein [Candidatus Hydrogenedentota bacterium]|nr:MAG: DUF342 domain-containing protein [Candidatus Hydrogenedentota bacterium]
MASRNPVRVRFDADFMTAFVETFPGEEDRPPTEAEILHALAQAGVKYGIDEDAVRAAAEGPFRKEIAVARGTKPKPGCDGSITFSVEMTKRTPREIGDGRVDYKDLQIVKNVVKGQLLAEVVPAMPGLPGKNVKGIEVPPPPVKEPELPVGRNVAVTPDGRKIVSLIDGHLKFERVPPGRILLHVDETFVLGKNVDLSTGNLFCIGNCEVRGGVREGFQVVAKGDILIHGMVEGAEVISHQGSVVLRSGIKGQNKGVVRAARAVKAPFLENCTVEAQEEIEVVEHIYHSRVRTRTSLRLTGAPGVIMGGELSFFERLNCRQLGSESNPKTRVYFGDWVTADAEARLEEITPLLEELRKERDTMRESLAEMRRLALEDPEKNKAKIMLITKSCASFPKIKERIETLEAEERELLKQIVRRDVKIVAEVEGTVFPGVILQAPRIEDVVITKPKRNVRIVFTAVGKHEPAFSFRPRRGK